MPHRTGAHHRPFHRRHAWSAGQSQCTACVYRDPQPPTAITNNDMTGIATTTSQMHTLTCTPHTTHHTPHTTHHTHTHTQPTQTTRTNTIRFACRRFSGATHARERSGSVWGQAIPWARSVRNCVFEQVRVLAMPVAHPAEPYVHRHTRCPLG